MNLDIELRKHTGAEAAGAMAAEPSPSSWSDIARKDDHQTDVDVLPHRLGTGNFSAFKSSEGINVLVVDTSALIDGGEKLMRSAEKFVSVKEVLDEIKDPVTRHRMAFMPHTIQSMYPTEEALKQVISFARATGDLQSLSAVDLKLIALTYSLEAETYGTAHLRNKPPPLHVVRVRRLPEKDLPGWGSNVRNLEEWEELDKETGSSTKSKSRILGLKNLTLNERDANGSEDGQSKASMAEQVELKAEGSTEPQTKPRKYKPQKREVKIDSKLMVAEGIDASKGESKENMEDWQPAVSRSTRRRYLKRQARRALNQTSAQSDIGAQEQLEEETPTEGQKETSPLETNAHNGDMCNMSIRQDSESEDISSDEEDDHDKAGACNVSGFVNGIANNRHEDEHSESSRAFQEQHTSETFDADKKCDSLLDEGGSEDEKMEVGDLDHEEDENASLDDGNVGSQQLEDSASEQSWKLHPFSNSSIACATNDFAMQNVILQMGLRLLTPNGIQVRQLHRWVLKCHACNGVTADVGKIFCPKCGNGGTLRKISVTVSENGIVQAGRRPRISIRGTRYSLPLPKGGRDAITKNPILREDQLAHKILYPKEKKSAAKQGIDMLSSEEFTFQTKDKKAPLQAPVRKTVAVFTGRRNPNDNHFSRRKH